MIHAYASLPHYVDHLAPIWRALDPDLRGRFMVPKMLVGHAAARGVDAEWMTTAQALEVARDSLTMVAAYNDQRTLERYSARFVFVEHGAGQHYGEGVGNEIQRGGYAGGPGRWSVALFICPNDEVAERNRATYPDAEISVVGSPMLEDLSRIDQAREAVAFSWHWPCTVWPESNTAFPFFAEAVSTFGRQYPGEVLGHAHPRYWAQLKRWYDRRGWTTAETFSEVVARARVYVCDNSSTIFEAAALDIPVVLLNSPKYRRDVHHGLRFWTWADIGPQVDHPSQLAEAIADADADRWTERRAAMRDAVFGEISGAADRAAAAIGNLL